MPISLLAYYPMNLVHDMAGGIPTTPLEEFPVIKGVIWRI